MHFSKVYTSARLFYKEGVSLSSQSYEEYQIREGPIPSEEEPPMSLLCNLILRVIDWVGGTAKQMEVREQSFLEKVLIYNCHRLFASNFLWCTVQLHVFQIQIDF